MTRLNSIASLPISEATRRRNPHLFTNQAAAGVPVATKGRGAVRLRQDTKPLMNGLETAFHAILQAKYTTAKVRPQAKRYRLANGIWYKPDFTAIIEGVECAWECKGPRAFRGGFENLKVAAHEYPEIAWILVWKDEAGAWREQRVLP